MQAGKRGGFALTVGLAREHNEAVCLDRITYSYSEWNEYWGSTYFSPIDFSFDRCRVHNIFFPCLKQSPFWIFVTSCRKFVSFVLRTLIS